MTVLSAAARVAYAGDGATLRFPVPGRIWSLADLRVHLRAPATLVDRLLTFGVDFAWDGSPLPGPGAVIFATAPPVGTRITISHAAELVQELDLQASGAFSAETIEAQFDRVVTQMQSLDERIARAPLLPPGSDRRDLPLPEPHPTRGGQLLGITADGSGFECKVPVNLSLQTVSAFASTLLDDPDAATARATLGIGTSIDLALLPVDTTGGAAGDTIPFVDASEANASNRVAVPAFMANAVASLPGAVVSPDHEVLARSIALATAQRIPVSQIAAGRQTIWIPAAAFTPRLTAGASALTTELPGNRLTLRTLEFDPAVQEHAQVLIQMPRSWNRAALAASVTWCHGPAASNFNVVWGLRLLSVSDGSVLDTPFGSTVQVTDTGGVAQALYRTPETPPFGPATTPPESATLSLDLFRFAADAGDTLPVDARLIGVTLFYVTQANTDA
jgi:hypothetical protein